MRVVIESPLSGDFQRNFRYLLWCCRAVWLQDGAHAIASHMLNPWFMNDTDPAERKAGIDNPWVWVTHAPHWFFVDLGFSGGMILARERLETANRDLRGAARIAVRNHWLADYAPACWAAFKRGEWPPHTPGFEVRS